LKTNLGINSLDSITRPNKNVTAGLPLSPLESMLNKAQSTLDRAISQDQQKNDQEALDLYIEAVELFIKARNETQDESFKSGLNIKIKQLLDRAEDLKGLPAKPRQTLPVQSASPRKLPTFTSLHSKLTAKEIEVLKNSSYINDKVFLPWLEIDLQEKFEYDEPFIDPDGTLPLSNYQMANFDSWKRPSEFMDKPKMIAMISSETIRQ
ncbi:2452_t:CDS:2, partial [Acaulospora morrowiae]